MVFPKPSKRYSAYLTALMVMLCSSAALADYKIKASELRRMPAFCHNLSQANFAEDALKLRRPSRSPGFPHLQHYCHGLKFLARAALHASEAREAYSSAVGEFNYVLSHTEAEHKYTGYLSSTLLNRASALVGLKRHNEAIADFYKVIKLKPKHTKTYIKLSDYYKNLGNREEAINVLERGLKEVPKSKALLRRKKRLISNVGG